MPYLIGYITLSVFLFPDGEADPSVCAVLVIIWFSVAVLTRVSLHMLQDAGVLARPAERQLFGGEDGSRVETSESHQQSAK